MTTKAELKAVPVIRQPTLSFLGDLPLVTLAPLDRLHPATLARIARRGAKIICDPAAFAETGRTAA